MAKTGLRRNFKPRTVPGSSTIGAEGLYAGRAVTGGLIEDIQTATARYGRFFGLREFLIVNEVKGDEAQHQEALRKITLKEAQDRVRKEVGSFASTLTVMVEKVGLIPKRQDQGSVVIIDLARESQQQIIDERLRILNAIDGLVPDVDLDWPSKFTRPGIPLGQIEAHNNWAQRNAIRSAIQGCLPEEITLEPGHLLPYIT